MPFWFSADDIGYCRTASEHHLPALSISYLDTRHTRRNVLKIVKFVTAWKDHLEKDNAIIRYYLKMTSCTDMPRSNASYCSEEEKIPILRSLEVLSTSEVMLALLIAVNGNSSSRNCVCNQIMKRITVERVYGWQQMMKDAVVTLTCK